MPTVYATVPPEEAAHLAQTVVEERLAACVNRVDCNSVYRWDGEIHDDEEVILLAKTSAERCDELETRLAELHPHDVPCIERFDETDLLGAFGEWIRSETTG